MKISLLIVIVFTFNIYSQSNYNRGFDAGYKKGYCQDQGVGCIPPVPPISPIPRVNESSESYNDGYNRGFKMGLNAQSSDGSSSKTTERKRYQTSSPEFDDHTYKPDYSLSLLVAKSKIQYNKLKNRLIDVMIEKNDMLIKEKRYDELFSINDRAIKVSKEQSFNKLAEIAHFYKSLAYLDKYYETGNAFNLGKAYDNAVRAESHGQSIDILLEQINKAKKFETEKQNINYNIYYSFDDPVFEVPMYAKPNITTDVIYRCPKDSKIKILRKFDDIFFEVVINNHRGYITKSFVKMK